MKESTENMVLNDVKKIIVDSYEEKYEIVDIH